MNVSIKKQPVLKGGELNYRQAYENLEEKILSPQAALSKKSKGRRRSEEPCSIRTDFQRDRDRIVHSKAFRRLMHKTQVFLSPEGDHYRTRLTHTLEVAQISRTIARALRLNEDLTEAIALGHDLGHTPFGHIGEEALTECFQQLQKEKIYPKLPVRFEHNLQSLRVVEVIEHGGNGLNLTWEVKDGIATHTGAQTPQTLEGQIVRISDRIAYINHDIDDALRADIISFDDIPKSPLAVVGKGKSARINSLVFNLIEASLKSGSITMDPPYVQAMDELRQFLFEKVYVESIAKAEDVKAKGAIKKLFFYYLEKPEEMPPEFHTTSQDELPQRVCDYVAGMTDRYALSTYESLFLPKPWLV